MYPHQAERLSEALERAQIEALVATSRANVAYITGFDPGPTEPGVVVAVFARGGVALVVPSDEAVDVVSADLDLDHVVCHGERIAVIGAHAGETGRRLAELTAKPAREATEALAAALQRLGCSRGRLGLDEAALPATVRAALTRTLEPERVMAGSEALARARMVKAPWELECLQRALFAAEEAIAAALALTSGTTEREAAAIIEREIARAGAKATHAIVAFGANGALARARPGDRAARRGDLVRFDVGCVWRGYHADVARLAVLGEPEARQQALHDAVDAGIEAALATIAPGVAGARVLDAVVEAVRARGIEGFRAAAAGDGIGLEPVEPPRLAPGGAPALEAGTVLRLVVPYYEVGWAGITIKETLLVARTGPVTLNRSRRGLVVLEP